MSTTLAEDYLSAYGDLVTYHQGLRHGHRIGQAFFNALGMADRERLVGTSHDPFYADDSQSVESAIEQLLEYR